jgi:hypothetical protein
MRRANNRPSPHHIGPSPAPGLPFLFYRRGRAAALTGWVLHDRDGNQGKYLAAFLKKIEKGGYDLFFIFFSNAKFTLKILLFLSNSLYYKELDKNKGKVIYKAS